MWLKQNEIGGNTIALSPTNRMLIDHSNYEQCGVSLSESSLVITDVVGSDSGNYYCVVWSLIADLK